MKAAETLVLLFNPVTVIGMFFMLGAAIMWVLWKIEGMK